MKNLNIQSFNFFYDLKIMSTQDFLNLLITCMYNTQTYFNDKFYQQT